MSHFSTAASCRMLGREQEVMRCTNDRYPALIYEHEASEFFL